MSFIEEVGREVKQAESRHAKLNSLHEAYAVILEEVDELWEQVRLKREKRSKDSIRRELVQIAAMAWRTARDLGLEELPHAH